MADARVGAALSLLFAAKIGGGVRWFFRLPHALMAALPCEPLNPLTGGSLKTHPNLLQNL